MGEEDGDSNLEKACHTHPGLTDPNFPGQKLSDGSDADPLWYKPYQALELNEMLTEVGFSDGSFGDCNPARCDNPPECGIPVCRGYLNGANVCGEKRCKEGTQGHDHCSNQNIQNQNIVPAICGKTVEARLVFNRRPSA